MSNGAARAGLRHLGLAAGVSSATPSYECTDGSTVTLAARPTVLDCDGAPDWSRNPVVVSLARWDRIKHPLGMLDGFLERELAASDAHLLLAGPDANQVADDPEAAAVLAEVRERWRRLPPPARARIHLACLPLTSPDENDAMVNAIQRQAAVVVKKSLQEGFGLGVTEAMWKARPVVAIAVGGCERRAWHRQGWTPSKSVRHLGVRTGLECRDRDRATCDLDRTRLPAQRARLRGRDPRPPRVGPLAGRRRHSAAVTGVGVIRHRAPSLARALLSSPSGIWSSRRRGATRSLVGWRAG